MRKTVMSLFAAVMALLCVVSAALSECDNTSVKRCSTLQEVNETIGCNLCHPAVMGVVDESYTVYDHSDLSVGEYIFYVNGRKFILSAAADAAYDIVRIYDDNGDPVFAGYPATPNSLDLMETETVVIARWMSSTGIQYALVIDHEDAEFETLADVCCEIAALTEME